jgi:hypothetical protein
MWSKKDSVFLVRLVGLVSWLSEFYCGRLILLRASRSAMSTRCPPLLKVGRAGRSRLLFLDLKKRRRADSTSSDLVHPLRAASRFRIAIIESSMFRVVFIFYAPDQATWYGFPIGSKSLTSSSASFLLISSKREMVFGAYIHSPQ